jgi:hypothetical protein
VGLVACSKLPSSDASGEPARCFSALLLVVLRPPPPSAAGADALLPLLLPSCGTLTDSIGLSYDPGAPPSPAAGGSPRFARCVSSPAAAAAAAAAVASVAAAAVGVQAHDSSVCSR